VHEPVFRPLWFAAALAEWGAAHPQAGSVTIVGAPSAVRWYLDEFEGRRRLRDRLARGIAGGRAFAVLLSRLIKRLLVDARRHVPRRPSRHQAAILAYTQVLSGPHLEEIGDHYFGNLLHAAEAAGELLTAYGLNTDAERGRVERFLSRAGRPHVFLLDDLTWRDLPWIGWRAAAAAWSAAAALRRAPAIRLGRHRSTLFARVAAQELALSQPPIVECATYRALHRLLGASRVHTVVYPYEEKGLERAILLACSEGPRPVRTIGYAHAAHTDRHLALRSRPTDEPAPPMPDGLWVTGPRARDWFVTWARKDPERLTVVGSPRHTAPLGGRERRAADAPLRVLVVISLDAELPVLASWLERQPDLFRNCDVLIRRYRFAWREGQDRGLARLTACAAAVRTDDGTLAEQLRWADVVIFGTSSAGLEAMLAGCLVIRAALHDLVDGDPLLGEEAAFASCGSAEQLAAALVRAAQLSEEARQEALRRQRRFAEEVFAPIDAQAVADQLRRGGPSTRDAVRWQCVERLPPGGGWYATYDHRHVPAPGWRSVDLRAIIRAHQPAWLEAFDAWHADLSRAALTRTPWWWFTAASRPNPWVHQDVLKPLFMAAAACEWMREHPHDGPLTLVGCPPAVGRYLEEFAGRPLAPASWTAAWHSWRSGVRGLWSLCRQHLTRYSWRAPRRQSARTLIYSHILQARAWAECGDHYFGPLLELARGGRREPVVLGCVLHDDAERDRVLQAVTAAGHQMSYVLDHLSWPDPAWTVGVGGGIGARLAGVWRVVPPIRLGPWSSRGFGRQYVVEQALGRPPGLELLVYRAMRRLLRAGGATTVVYPYEEKGLERALLRACGDQRRPIRTLAYAHAAHTWCHLPLRTRPAGPNPPQPKILLATGPEAADFLIRWGRKPADRVAVIGSARHLEPIPSGRAAEERRQGLRVLVLTGFGHELLMLAEFVARRPDLFGPDEVRIRRYDFAWRAEQDEGLARLSRALPRVRADEAPLREQLAWCDVALFCSTSAGVQAMLAGRLAVWAQLQDVFEADPLLGSQACLARCAGPEELAAALAQARALPDAAYAQVVRRQRIAAEAIYAPVDAQAWRSALHGAAPRASSMRADAGGEPMAAAGAPVGAEA
jgi:hypothetical protein